jgi:hypothetical protein
VAAITVLAAATAVTGAASGAARAGTTATSWTENLSQPRSTTAVNVTWSGGALRVASSRLHTAADPDRRGYGQDVLPEHALAAPANQVTVTLRARRPAGSDVRVDLRGRGPGGRWTEWVVAAASGATRLPRSVTTVQARITLRDTPRGVSPAVTGLALSASAGPASRTTASAAPDIAALSYQVYATREGLVGGTTANGHVIVSNDHFVALPSGTALSPNGTDDYSVQVCGPSACETAPVWDVGPWNTQDNYWDANRAEFTDLPQGEPEAQAAYENGYNGGLDEFGRTVSNPAGIDLADGTFYDIGLNDNGWVTVTYLWTSGGGGGPSVTGMGQCDTSSAADCSNTAVGNGSDCYSGHFCIYTGPNYTGTVFSFYNCQYNGADWALQNWNGAGSYINQNTGGADAYIKDQNHNVLTTSAPGDTNSSYDFGPAWYVQAC